MECIDSTYVSYVGQYVTQFEKSIQAYTGANHAVAMVNGTEALHIALLLAGVKQKDEVITQPLTFVATANAISYCGALPVFVDVDRSTLGLDPEALENFLELYGEIKENSVQARPVWTLVNHLPMFSSCQCGPLGMANWLEDRLANLPSSVTL